jgi:hypothetical protein
MRLMPTLRSLSLRKDKLKTRTKKEKSKMPGLLDDVFQQQEEQEAQLPPETEENNLTGNEEGSTDDATTGDKPETPPTPVPPTPQLPTMEELNELRQLARDQRRELAEVRAALSRAAVKEELDEEGNPKPVVLTPLEKITAELHNVAVTKTPVLEILLETMELSPAYADVREVCSRSNFADILEDAAKIISREHNLNYNEVLVQLELDVWKRPNPYKYMYKIIKENHRSYKTEAKAPAAPPGKTAANIVKEAPGSIANLDGGDTKGSSQWTAARIDALPETDLHLVPTDVYSRYMRGTLK